MKNHLLFWGVLAIFVKAVHVKAQEGERIVLVDNKCKCARITSRIIRSSEDPNEDIVERNIRIIVPLNNRENISDPTSPLRTKFVYHLSDLCKKCDPTEVELDNQIVTATQSNICDEDSATETCYTYDRNKCYTAVVPLTYAAVNGVRMSRTLLEEREAIGGSYMLLVRLLKYPRLGGISGLFFLGCIYRISINGWREV
uniref:Joining chain of multimeric IgA and IgM n=1 Tax=Macaca mulatta TaxID=9544 RepID=A0A5F7ZGW2_MACMU